MSVNIVEGDFMQSSEGRYALVVGRFNSFVVDSLEAGALDVLRRHGIEDSNITIVRVPGAFEIPLAVQRVGQQQKPAAIIALGAVIRGGTPHFEYVAGECVKGISQMSLALGIPVAFGVLTLDTIEQAIERSGTKAGNKGAEAAITAIEMVSVLRKVGA